MTTYRITFKDKDGKENTSPSSPLQQSRQWQTTTLGYKFHKITHCSPECLRTPPLYIFFGLLLTGPLCVSVYPMHMVVRTTYRSSPPSQGRLLIRSDL